MQWTSDPIRLLRHILITALLSSSSLASADLFFSEYIEGSSNNKALEIYNNTGASVDLSAYEVQMFFNGNTNAALTIALQGTLPDGEVYVLAHSAAHPDILAAADQTNGAGWFNGDDAVALLYGGNPIDVIGQIGVDPGSQWGTGDTATANKTLRRMTSVTEGDADGYDAFDPAQQWEGFAQDTFAGLGQYSNHNNPDPTDQCGMPATKIHTIQGDGATSSFIGTTQTIEGVVVGDFQGSDRLSGFFVQEEDSDRDNNSLTSEGIFIFDSTNAMTINAGDLVRITGNVSEYFNMTQITAASMQVCATGVSVTPSVLVLPVTTLSDLERHEGMAIVVHQDLTVTENYNLGRYGELVLSADGRLFNPTQVAMPGAAAQAVAAQNNLRRILLDDGSGRQNPAVIPYPAPELSAYNTVRSGDRVTGLQGVLHYAFDEYRIQPTSTPIFVPDNARTPGPDLPDSGSLKIASFNVLNYFNGDGLGGGFPTSRGANTPEEFARQRAKIIAALVAMDADIVGLIEIENDGYGPQSAIQDLVNGLYDAGLDYAVVNPGVAQIGTDEITVGFIYKPETVELINASAILDSSIDPRFIDNKNRPVLAQSFREIATQGVVTLAVTHLKSKGSDCNDLSDPDTGDGQGNCNITRTTAAEAMTDWLASDPTGSDDTDVLIMGDLNAYAKEDPITTIEAAGYVNLLKDFSGDLAYSYVFTGLAGYLDHALASNSLRSQVTGAADWHINADEPRVLDYNEEFKTPQQVISLYSPEAWRASDHDPLIIELALTAPQPEAVRGDFNEDQKINGKDLKLLLRNLGKKITDSNSQFDLNDDGRISLLDMLIWTLWLAQSKHS
jgi:predicted extracellular nuclease